MSSSGDLLTFSKPVDSCSSTFSGWKRIVETPTPESPAIVTISPTILNHTIMTELPTDSAATIDDNSFRKEKDKYDHVEFCEGRYNEDFCLNGGTCIIHKLGGETISYDCVCDSHYFGKRCEDKMFEGSYSRGMKLRLPRSNRRRRNILHRRSAFTYVKFVSCTYEDICLV